MFVKRMVRIEHAYREEERPLLASIMRGNRLRIVLPSKLHSRLVERPLSLSTKSIWTLNAACLAC